MDNAKHLHAKTVLTLITAAILGGCASVEVTPERTIMPLKALSSYKVDCGNKQQQLAFLKQQMPTQNERRAARDGWSLWQTDSVSSAEAERRNIAGGWTGVVIYEKIRQLEAYCP